MFMSPALVMGIHSLTDCLITCLQSAFFCIVSGKETTFSM